VEAEAKNILLLPHPCYERDCSVANIESCGIVVNRNHKLKCRYVSFWQNLIGKIPLSNIRYGKYIEIVQLNFR